MKDEKIPSLTDREWSEKNELGSVTEVVEYSTGDGPKQVRVTVKLISGEEIEAIEAECATFEEDGTLKDIDKEKFKLLRYCKMFGTNEVTMKNIMKNKSSDLRNKLILLAEKHSGENLSEEEIAKEKNSEGPVS